MKIENVDHLDTGKRSFIELGTQLQIEIEGVASRLKSTLVGMEPDNYLIIKTPGDTPFGSIKHKLFRGSQFTVRYLHRGTVFGFQSRLIEAISTPRKLLFLEYPNIVENCDLRSDERIDCLFPTKITIKDEERHGAILDISQRGCRYLTKTLKGEKLPSVQIDEQVTLRCQFPGIEGVQVLSGKVRNMKTDEQETTLGIEFHEIAPEVQNIIGQYVSGDLDFLVETVSPEVTDKSRHKGIIRSIYLYCRRILLKHNRNGGKAM